MERGVGGVEPDVRAVLGDEIGHFADEGRVEDGFVVRVVEGGQRDAPTALARDAPVGAGFHRAVDAVAAPVRNPLHLVDGAKGGGAEFVHADEELVHRAEDDGHLAAPTMRVGVVDLALAREGVEAPEHLDDVRGLASKTYWPTSVGDAAFVGEAALVVDGREDGQAVLAPDEVVVVAVAGGDVDAAGARVHRDEFAQDDLDPWRSRKGMLVVPAFEFAAEEAGFVEGGFAGVAGGLAEGFDEGVGEDEGFDLARVRVAVVLGAVAEAGVDRDGLVGGERPGRGGPDDDAEPRCGRAGRR